MKTELANKQFDQSMEPSPRDFYKKRRAIPRALIVDDDENMREALSWVLTGMGFGVRTAKNGREALNLFRRYDFEIIITDLNMPMMDGLTLAGYIKEWSPQTPVILMSGQIKKPAMGFGHAVDHMLSKPFGIRDIEAAVQKFLDRSKDLKRMKMNA